MSCKHVNKVLIAWQLKALYYTYDVLGRSEKVFAYLSAFTPVGCIIWGNCHLHKVELRSINWLYSIQLHYSHVATANEYLHSTLQHQSIASHLAPLVGQLVRSRGWHWVSPCDHGIQPSPRGDLWDQQHQNSKSHEQFQSTDNVQIL